MFTEWNQALAAELLKPFPPEQIELRPGATTKDKAKCLALAYADLRTYQERLDELVGPQSWEVQFYGWGDNRMVCTLTILHVSKSDVGECNEPDANAGTIAAAQAFKRACSAFGLGRYIYNLPDVWAPMNEYKQIIEPEAVVRQMYAKGGIDNFAHKSTSQSVNATEPRPVNTPKPTPPRAQSAADLITPGQLISIRTLAKNANPPIDPEAECRKLFASDLCELSQHGGRQMIEHLKQQTGQAKGEPVKADATVFWSFVRRTPGVTDLMARTALNKWTAEDGVTDWAGAIQAVKDQLTRVVSTEAKV